MKKLYKLGAVLGIAATFGLGGSAFAAAPQNIYYYMDGVEQCSLLDGSTDVHFDCSTIGTYDATSNTLTLNPQIGGATQRDRKIVVSSDQENDLTISATKNVEGIEIDAQNTKLTFDFGNYSFTDPSYTDNTSTSNKYKELTIKSGTIYSGSGVTVNSFKLEGGKFETKQGVLNALLAQKNINIIDGTLKLSASSSGVSLATMSGDVNISGGTVDINGPGIVTYSGDVKISGGTVNLKSSNGGTGIMLLSESKNLTISGGDVTIDGFLDGINTKSKVYFNGGTTTIKNIGNDGYGVIIDPSSSADDIVFGEGIGIKEEGLEVSHESNKTWIARSGTVTIASIKDDDEDEEEDDDVKVPDTGMFTGIDGGTTTTLISLGALTAGFSIAYIAVYVAKRFIARAKFNK